MMFDNATLSLIAKALNTFGLFILAYGLSQRRRPRIHMPVMLTAFAIDVFNVILVEVLARSKEGKGAVEQATSVFTEGGTTLQYVHIGTSFLCIVGYVVAVITGTRLWRRGVGRTAHRVNAAAFIVTRLVSYVTSFWM